MTSKGISLILAAAATALFVLARNAAAELPADFSADTASFQDTSPGIPEPGPADNAEENREAVSELTGLMVGPGAFPPSAPLLRPFTSDGCSMSPDGLPGKRNKWVDCCVKHDIAYWLGGTEGQRKEADKALRRCIAGKGFHTIAEVYYRGVRLGGGPDMNTSYRWGYGWNRLRPYSPLKDEELGQAEFLYGKGLARLLALEAGGGIRIDDPPDAYNYAGKLTEEEIGIYEHLKNSLAAADVVLSAKSDSSRTETLIYSLKLKDCPGLLTYTFKRSSRELRKVEGGGACLKNTGEPALP